MIEWAFVLTPFLVLPLVMLFRFIGCTSFEAEEPPAPKVPNYRDFIMGEPDNPGSVPHPQAMPTAADVIGYWRLVDGAASLVAKDEKGFQDGKYRTSTDPDTIPGDFVTGQPSLIVSDQAALGRFFNGGWVLVPAKHNLYTDAFTIEAWVLPGFADNADHTLFHAGGHYRAPLETQPAYHGFHIYATGNPSSWQVSLTGGKVFPAPPLIPKGNRPTHLAVTVRPASPGGGLTTVTMFIDGIQAVQQTVGAYSRPDGAPLLIGVMGEQNEPSDLATLPQPNVKHPMRSRIQEVVLHRKALSQEEIKNHVAINQ